VRVPRLVPATAAVALALAAPAGAATVDDVEVIAKDLDNPRHLAVGPFGDIYVAEAGRGGDFATSKSCFTGPEMDRVCTGATGAVTRIAKSHRRPHGGYKQERIITGLASFANEAGAAAEGPHGIYVDGRNLYVTNGGPTAPKRDGALVLRRPTLETEERVSQLFGTLLKFSRHDRPRLVADLWLFERDNNPDRTAGNPEIDSNPVDVFARHGRVVVADAGGNTLLGVGRRRSVGVVALFPNVPTPGPGGAPIPMNAVPTGVVEGPDGAYYVSQLTGFPFPAGGAKVFRVDPRGGEPTTYATGFTNAMDLAFGRDGTLYVLEIDSNSLAVPGDEGGLWAVPPGGGAPVKVELPAGTLTNPGGIAVGRRGDLYVTNRATSPGTGEVLKIDLDD
jgi:hypothetical protein